MLPWADLLLQIEKKVGVDCQGASKEESLEVRWVGEEEKKKRRKKSSLRLIKCGKLIGKIIRLLVLLLLFPLNFSFPRTLFSSVGANNNQSHLLQLALFLSHLFTRTNTKSSRQIIDKIPVY